MILNIEDIRDFWKDMAEAHIDLRHNESNPHFMEFDFEEVNQVLKSNKAFPLLALSSYDDAEMGYHYMTNPQGVLVEVFRGELLILDKISDRADSYKTRSSVYSKTMNIWRDIDARINWRVQRLINSVECGPINNIAKAYDRTKTTIKRVGAKSEGSNGYGWHIYYEMRAPYTLVFNEDKFL